MKIAVLTTDNREPGKQYQKTAPFFGTAPEALLQGFAAFPKIEVHVISCLQHSVDSPEKIAPNIFFHALTVPKIGWMRTGYQGCIRAVRKKMRAIQPDIVHGQGTERECAISAVFSGFPNVLTIHGNMKAIAELHESKFCSFHWLAARLETVALKKTSGVFCNSAYTEDLVAPRAKMTWRVPNALRQEFFAALPDKTSIDKCVLLNVGVVQARKQQLEILAIARNLHLRGLKFEMWFVGELSSETGYCAEFTKELAVAEKLGYARHLGSLTTAQLIAIMDKSAALVHFPSEEAFGLVVAEALSRNLKFFGAAIGGIMDIAADVEGAELFPAQKISILERAIEQWLLTGSPRPHNAKATISARYHPQIIAQQHLDIYREVLTRL